ncbi:thioredoxin family protein [Pontibacter ummariensis]|nr:thioredoxin family protein [Pontibacter ummariensis]
MAKRKIEMFTAGCPVCEPVVEMVQSMACESCDVTIYNLAEQCDTKECVSKVKEYNITSLPAVVVNGELLSCCAGRGVSREQLEAAGIGNTA